MLILSDSVYQLEGDIEHNIMLESRVRDGF